MGRHALSDSGLSNDPMLGKLDAVSSSRLACTPDDVRALQIKSQKVASSGVVGLTWSGIALHAGNKSVVSTQGDWSSASGGCMDAIISDSEIENGPVCR